LAKNRNFKSIILVKNWNFESKIWPKLHFFWTKMWPKLHFFEQKCDQNFIFWTKFLMRRNFWSKIIFPNKLQIKKNGTNSHLIHIRIMHDVADTFFGNGYISLWITYATFIVANFISAGCLKIFGHKAIMVIGW